MSSYLNYRWMPELTIRMIHHMINNLGIKESDRILDYGCAKGFIVKAFRILGYDAHGVDISEYAIKSADSEVREFCNLIIDGNDKKIFNQHYDWMISKDVFEHIQELELRQLLQRAQNYVDHLFAVIPVAAEDYSNKYIIPDYDRDVTHVIAKSIDWWHELFQSCDWNIDKRTNKFPGCKENWTSRWHNGNAFFILSSKHK